MKILNWMVKNGLLICTLFLLAFIPLYPKIPLIDIRNTWVYIRLDDIAVAIVLFFWIIQLLRRKVTLKTPLTFPILLFWIIGGIATLHGVLVIFPTVSNVYSNVAFLSFLRRIEYMSLFFVAYFAIKDKRTIFYVISLLSFVLLVVVGYGFGQKLLGFPAFLTMNEEFAKGTPIQLSELSRVPSTFAGHYDLAAYLVLIIPIMISMIFGFKKIGLKIFFIGIAAVSFVLLFMTVSRVSVVVLFVSLVLLFFMQKRKLVIALLLVLVVGAVGLLTMSPSLLSRFGNTVSEITVLVDAKTGNPVGEVKQVPQSYFADKIVFRQSAIDDGLLASASAILPFEMIPQEATLVVEPNRPNGENLPQGTSYINLPLSPIVKRTGQYFYQKSEERSASQAARVTVSYGDFVIKRAKAYDLSFTTRFQGEWPNALRAFQRNILLGSGYGSVSLAVDNDYLRLLGESGLAGFIAFAGIFVITGIYIKKTWQRIDSPVIRSFILGFVAGTVGLILNAVFIDVFEASKIAFVFWLLMGIVMGILTLYGAGEIHVLQTLKKIVISPYFLILYLFIFAFLLYSSNIENYFVGDDFTWLRWIVDCKDNCSVVGKTINFFTSANGFFYRPGTKMYFDLMYQIFWLNQVIYHLVSVMLNFFIAIILFLISIRVVKNYLLAFASSVIFLILSGPSEMILWIAATGHLFSSLFIVLSLLLFMLWKEKKHIVFLIFSIISIALSLLFYELGVVAPLLIILYDVLFADDKTISRISKKVMYALLFVPLIPYLFMRFIANSHWSGGDYSYNLLKLPFNFIGNLIGYFSISLFGPSALIVYDRVRDVARDNLFVASAGSLISLSILFYVYHKVIRSLTAEDKRILLFGIGFFFISLLPFLGLGNISFRYSYLASFGFCILFIFFLTKVYGFLLENGKSIAASCVVVIVLVFSSFQLFALQKVQGDWRAAGEKSKNFLVSLDYIYAHYPKEDTQNLYFVNVPIRTGDAWVFPVGIQDAVWLVFRTQDTTITLADIPEEAFLLKGNSKARVFQFTGDGNLRELRKVINSSGNEEIEVQD